MKVQYYGLFIVFERYSGGLCPHHGYYWGWLWGGPRETDQPRQHWQSSTAFGHVL